MQQNYVNQESLNKVALRLGELNTKMLYVGGSIVEFYSEEPSIAPRPTEDIDMTTSVPKYNDWTKLGLALRRLGISQDSSRSICSFTFEGIQIDIMPIETTEIGLANRWYQPGIQSAMDIKLTDTTIKILSAPYFIATKFEAFISRGTELRLSPDIEDIINLLDNRPTVVSEIANRK